LPFGRDHHERLDGGPAERAPLVNLVTLRENGPLAFRAPLRIEKQDGMSESALRATLCRCGHSKNKPYCDGAHASIGFHATGEPETKASEPLASRDGALTVQATPDGPLHVTGNLEILSGTGRTLSRTTDAWLCRCGHSKTKPYCDGSHRKAGWKSE
jgi:CDGSH-type Zn-finger protein